MLKELLHFFGGAICHQLEERSLFVDGKPLSICARCTGIYIGILSTLVYLHLFKRKENITIPTVKMSFFLLLLMAPMAIDGLGSYATLLQSNNLRRLITGISFGYVLPYLLYPLLPGNSLAKKSQPVIKQSKDLLIPLTASSFLGGLAYWGKISYLILDGLIVTIIIIWFSLCLSMLITRIRNMAVKWTVSIIGSLIYLSALSILHQMIVS